MTGYYSLYNGFPFVRYEKRDIEGDKIWIL